MEWCWLSGECMKNVKNKQFFDEHAHTHTHTQNKKIPILSSTLRNTSYDWGYLTERTNKAGRLLSQNISWPSGKFIGGSNGLNSMFHLRGNAHDYDNWELLGNPTWGWQNVVEYFNRIENSSSIDAFLPVNAFNNSDPFKQLLFDAATELGHKRLNDLNGNETIGIGEARGNVENGVRVNTAQAYLVPARNRSNLHVIKFAHVTKVTVDNTTGRATGLQFFINQTHEINVNVTKDVILSAGSIGTPHILQMSGIGPEKYMQRLNISTVRNLHAGWSMQSHISVPLFWKFNETLVDETLTNETIGIEGPSVDATDALYDYIKQRKGVLSEQSVFDVVGMFSAGNSTDTQYPNVSTHFAVFRRDDKIIIGEFLRQLGLNETAAQPIIDANQNADIAVAFVTLLRPSAMGKVRPRSIDPFDLPMIQANYLDRPDDLATIVQGIQLVRKFIETNVFIANGVHEIDLSIAECANLPLKKSKKVKTTTSKPPKKEKSKKDKKHKGETTTTTTTTTEAPIEPQPEPIVYGSDQYWECYAKELTTTLYPPVGTAKMGPSTDRFAVVDSRLNVHGLTGLRVIDESIMPRIVSANINAATVMIAEKGVDFIKEDYPDVAQDIVVEEIVTETTESPALVKEEL